jgi:hypothetical protein
MKGAHARRAIAIFLVAFAAFDITVIDMLSPQLCGDEQISFTFAGQNASREDLQASLEANNSDDSKSSQDSHSPQIGEDCFCCCSHILPGFAMKELGPGAPIAILVRPDKMLPSGPPQYTYHPPRSA